MCGATGAQQDIQQEQMDMMKQLSTNYETEFGEEQGILQSLTDTFQPILEAGPNQEGFSAAEKTALNSEATEGVAGNYAGARKALADTMAAQGGDAFTPAGATGENFGELNSEAAKQESAEQLQIEQADYATGRANFDEAATALESTAGLTNSTSAAGVANQGGEDAANTANQIAQANDSWIAPVLGAVGGVLGGVVDQNPGNIFG